MIKYQTTCLLLAVLMLLGVCIEPAFADDDQLPRRRPTAQSSLSQEQVNGLKQHWQDDDQPTIVVMVGSQQGEEIVYDQNSTTVSRIQSPLEGELLRAINGLTAITFNEQREKDLANALKRNAGEELPDDIFDQIKKDYQADITVDVVLLSAGRNELMPVMTVFDNRHGVKIGKWDFRNIPAQPEIAMSRRYATSIAVEFMNAYKNWDPNAKRWIDFDLFGRPGMGFDDRMMLKLSLTAEDIKGVSRTKYEFEKNPDVGYGRLRVLYEGDIRRLLLFMEDDALPEVDMTWELMRTNGLGTTAFVFPNVAPAWYAVTEEDHLNKIRAELQTIYKDSGRPTVGIIASPRLNRPSAAFEMPGWEVPEQSVSMVPLQNSVRQWFSKLGFDVVDDRMMREKLGNEARIAERYENVANLAEALGDKLEVDLIVTIDYAPDGSPTKGPFIIEMADRRTGLFIGATQFPDRTITAMQDQKWKVQADDPDMVARYVVGKLLDQWQEFSLDDPADPNSTRLSRLDVTVHNIEDFKDFDHLLKVFGKLDSAVGDNPITNLQMSSPVASFSINFRGNPDNVRYEMMTAAQAHDFAGQLSFPFGNTARIDLGPGLRLEEIEPSDNSPDPVVIQPPNPEPAEAGGQDGPVAGPAAPNAPSNPAQANAVAEAVKAAEDSVWLVYTTGGNYRTTGTAWTVKPGLLATNAHVIEGIREFAQKYPGDFEVVAYNDQGKQKKLKLDVRKMWTHELYDRTKWRFDYFDVGLMEVIEGDAGTPLQLAGEEQLKVLTNLDQVGYAGFPSDGIADAISRLPRIQMDVGTISALTDFKLMPTTRWHERVLTYTLRTRGGASGSPVFGPSGHVVAIHNTGNGRDVEAANGNNDIFVSSGFSGGVSIDVLSRFLEQLAEKGLIK